MSVLRPPIGVIAGGGNAPLGVDPVDGRRLLAAIPSLYVWRKNGDMAGSLGRAGNADPSLAILHSNVIDRRGRATIDRHRAGQRAVDRIDR